MKLEQVWVVTRWDDKRADRSEPFVSTVIDAWDNEDEAQAARHLLEAETNYYIGLSSMDYRSRDNVYPQFTVRLLNGLVGEAKEVSRSCERGEVKRDYAIQ